jgi:hypothetical protein
MHLDNNVLQEGSRIQVTGHGPFRGLSGAILIVDTIPAELEEPLCFYLIALEGALIKEPVWFADDEIELVAELLLNASSTGTVYNP